MTTATQNEVSCPKCGGAMWDNRISKRNPKQPDFKCKQRSCDGVIWPPRNSANAAPARQQQPQNGRQGYDEPPVGSMSYDEPTQPTGPDTTQRWKDLIVLHRASFRAALKLATEAEAVGISPTLEGVSALTAQLFIGYREAR